ncbi:HD domain-containing protein [Paenibacillus sp. JX-17]|uniref:HD domain-containing protein n=1 Tax=Paenibacillus lacisoli TaxID=3064525 RepID=A0ABT9CCZ9_9BACL|nr:HD domain-containing protein [Paenibacillus sp. JX-17]MDO7907144.1 HD domain-containing protein [Paenibacillus sp. JX-17]
MNTYEIIQQAELFVQEELGRDTTGHDWWHIVRVRNTAMLLASRYPDADAFIVELAALLHDVADEKLNPSKEEGLAKVRGWLNTHQVEEQAMEHMMTIISTMSFNGGKNPPMDTIEGQIVQDADRLDAIGAVGIARAFAYGGAKARPLHVPDQDFSELDYRAGSKSTIYHFYEKLLLLKDKMNTDFGRDLAEQRHQFMEQFLTQFYAEWNGENLRS